MKTVLIHCAMEKEGEKISRALNLINKENVISKKYNSPIDNFIKVYEGQVKNTKIVLLITGIGKQKTAIGLTKYLCENPKPDLIVNIGYAGSTNTKIGSWISINKSFNLDWDIPGEEKYIMKELGNKELLVVNQLEQLPCYSAEYFVNNTEIKENVIFDMELHSVGIIADLYNIKVMSLKKISDNLNMNDYYKTVEDANLMELESGIKYLDKVLE